MRRILLWMARSRWLREHLARRWFVRRAVRKFMPGEQLSDALAAAERYRASGIGSVFTLLGENLTTFAEAEDVARHYNGVLAEVAARKLPTEISVKLTQLGYDLDPDGALRLVDALAKDAATTGNWVWVDMEGSAYTEGTVSLYEQVAAAHRNVGLCIQTYLRRTPADVTRLLSVVPSIRLVKGAYDEPASIAFRSRSEVDGAYEAISGQLLEALAGGRASRVILGTHDTELVERIAASASATGLDRRRIEVQMLYGIRVDEQQRLAAAGFDVRALIAYGSHWFPWYMRRLAERPANVVFAMRQLLP